MTELIGILLIFISGALVPLAYAITREPYVRADSWNAGYARGIDQGIREARDPQGAPLRIEKVVR